LKEKKRINHLKSKHVAALLKTLKTIKPGNLSGILDVRG